MLKESYVKLYEQERKALREELYNLKSCQITFLTTSITATGLLLGLASTFASDPFKGIAFIFPLLVLIPSWWIFFDKATTITRVVGYYRILESLILDNCTAENYMGWENSLRLSRKMRKKRRWNRQKIEKMLDFSIG